MSAKYSPGTGSAFFVLRKLKLTSCSARFAPVKFMFTRKGCVRICLEEGSDAGSVDKVLDAALESGAEDFEQVPSDQGAVEMEVSLQNLLIELKLNT